MSDNLILFEFMECDNESSTSRRKQRLQVREHSDPFHEFDESEFIKRYRLSKQLVLDLCEELRPMFKQPVKSTDLSVEKKSVGMHRSKGTTWRRENVLIGQMHPHTFPYLLMPYKILTTLSFYATGSYQRPIGDIKGHSMAQQTVSSVIAEVTAIIDSPAMRKKYICFPKTTEERNKTRARFYEKFRFPGVLGCIDCTQIAIVKPVVHEERYYCRKHYHSLNVQLICDADMQFTSVDASYGGATHDSFIWNVHPLKSYLENVGESTWLLGDSGYPLRKFVLTPVINAAPGTPESNYTNIHVRTRNIIERAIGVLKARFRCLLVHRVLHYKPRVAASITNACVILHNICNRENIPVFELSNEDTLQEAQMQTMFLGAESGSISTNNEALQQGVATRNSVIHRLWLANY